MIPLERGGLNPVNFGQEAFMQKGYCLYSKLFNLLELVGYFRRAVLVPSP
jgi:hypothetical protein